MPNTDQNRFIAAIHPKNAGNLFSQRRNIIAVTLLAKLTKTIKILPDLRRCKAE